MRKLAILGSTGSIGTQALDVAARHSDRFAVTALVAHSSSEKLFEQVRQFHPQIAALSVEPKEIPADIKNSCQWMFGENVLLDVVRACDADDVLVSVVGVVGLAAVMESLACGKRVLLANKEPLVAGGELVTEAAKRAGHPLLPVDSEHSAIFQCLQSVKSKNDLKKLILTASGGPFFGKTKGELEKVTLKQALNHPSWSMGKKISIDSATMMNKGFEIIEAAHLFDVSTDDIDVIIHRQSVVHSMIELKDGSVIAQMAVPSMKLPIQYALTFPHHEPCAVESLNLSKFKELTFFEPDYETFESINLCKKAFEEDSCVVLNAANEKAVELFLKEKIEFLDIIKLIKKALEDFKNTEKPTTISEIIALDKKVKTQTEINIEKLRK